MNAEDMISEMFVENTGRALCDSGDHYGRHWERNQKEHPKNRPAVEWEIWGNGSIEYTINTYHYLISQGFETNHVTDAFNALNIGAEDWDCPDYYGVSAAAGEFLDEIGARADGDTWNTYNGDSALSQVLQGCHIDINGDRYVLIQLHNGCDVRGGYTDARLFKLNHWNDYITCENVYGVCTRDGVDYQISNMYDGYNITWDDEQPDNPEFLESDVIELWISE